jgi:hypothetical protein
MNVILEKLMVPMMLLSRDSTLFVYISIALSVLPLLYQTLVPYLLSFQWRRQCTLQVYHRDGFVYGAIAYYIDKNTLHTMANTDVRVTSVRMGMDEPEEVRDMCTTVEDAQRLSATRWIGRGEITVQNGITISRRADVYDASNSGAFGGRRLISAGGWTLTGPSVGVLRNFVDECMVEWTREDRRRNVDVFHTIIAPPQPSHLAKLSQALEIHSTKTFDNVFFDNVTLDKVKQPLEEFLSESSVARYRKMGWPRKLAYMFYGPPGTGKSSLIYAIRHRAKLPLLFVGSAQLKDFIELAPSISKMVIVFDDVDCFKGVDRDDVVETQIIGEKKDDDKKFKEESIFASLLAVLDGYNTLHECILVFTTNNYIALDTALIRPGRIDHHIEIKDTSAQAIRALFQKTFGEDLLHDSPLRTDYSMAYIANCLVRPNINNPSEAVRLTVRQ